MARANNGGWDFVKVGGTYQYKEDWFFAMVKVIEDNSTAEEYRFKLQVQKSTIEMTGDAEFEISHVKDLDGYYNGMTQLFLEEEYACKYKWIRDEVKTEK